MRRIPLVVHLKKREESLVSDDMDLKREKGQKDYSDSSPVTEKGRKREYLLTRPDWAKKKKEEKDRKNKGNPAFTILGGRGKNQTRRSSPFLY